MLLHELPVREIMSRNVVAVRPEMSIRELAQLLLRSKVSGAPVVDDQGKVIGVVSKSDLIDRTHNDEEAYGLEKLFYRNAFGIPERLGRGFHLDAVVEGSVEEIMTPLVLSLPADTTLAMVARMMAYEGVHRIVVTDEGKMVGIVTTMDIVRAIAERASPTAPAKLD